MIFVATGLLCFALSFTPSGDNGRPVLFTFSLAFYILGVALAESKSRRTASWLAS